MMRWHEKLLTIAVVFLLASSVWGEEFAKRPFFWADDENYKPLIYRNAAGKPEGLFYEIVTEVFKRMHIPLKVKLYPWSRAQKLVKEGVADGMVTTYTRERSKFLVATDPVLVVEERIFANRKNPKIDAIMRVRTFDGLKKYVFVDTIDAGWSKEHLKDARVIWVPTIESALNMIAAGRADIYLMNNFTGPSLLKDLIEKGGAFKKRYRDIVMGNHAYTHMAYRLLIRKDSPYASIVDRFNKTLCKMRCEGVYDKIVERYRTDTGYHALGY